MAKKIFLKVDDSQTPEQKAGVELLNDAFNALDEATQKSLECYRDAQKAENDAIMQKSVTLENSLKEFKETADKQGKSYTEQIDELKKSLIEMNKAKVSQEQEKRKSFADSIGEAMEGKQAEVNEYLANKNKGYQVALKAASNMGVVTGAVGPLYTPIVGPAHEMVHARNFIPVSPTVSNLIRYVRFTNDDVNGVVGIATINSLKNQFDYIETIVDAPVIKIAGWINVADEFLEDIVGATSWLSADLPMKLYDAEDVEVFKGPGTTGHLSGLYTNATALTLPYAGVLSTANNIDKLLAASTYVRRQKRVATAAWTSPEDYLNILINKSSGATAVYTYPIVFNGNTNMLMLGDLPVIQHTVFNPGEGFVGDFTTGCRIFQKADATLRFSTENVDNFVKNVTTVLVEERIALADFYPESFVKVTLNGTYSG
jgi:HK97 family phage major capsid protein